MAQDEFQRVQELIAAGRFDEARAALQSIDRPEVPQLLAMIDQMQQTAQQMAAPAGDTTPDSAGGGLLDRLSQEAQSPVAPQPSPPPPPAAPRPARQPVRMEGNRRVHDEGTYEMLWDCQFCGATKLLAKTHRYCPNCGAAQDPDSRYFPAEGEYVAVEDHVYVGVDKICPNCEALNSAAAEFCGTCGAPLTEAARARAQESQTRQQGERFASSGSHDLVQERFDAEMERVGVKKPQAKSGGKRLPTWAIILIGLVVLGCIGALVTIFWTRGTDAILTGHSWERTISIERYGPEPGSAWCDSMPFGAYNVTRRSEVRSYNQVPDGEDCEMRRVDQGDGTFRQERVCQTRYRQEPVYDDKCYFTIDTWSFERNVNASGEDARSEPYWPQVSLTCEGQSRIGCERVGSRQEVYDLHLRSSEGQDFTCGVAQNVWSGAAIESRWQVQMGVIDKNPRCDTLQPAS